LRGAASLLAMYILTVPWDLRALWSVTSISAKLYLVCLFLVAAYTIVCLAKAIYYLRTLPLRESSDAQLFRATLAARMRHLRQIHFLFLLIFGAFFASEFFGIIRAIRYSSASLSAVGMEIFEPAAGFAFVVFAVLSFLHAIQWFVSGRIDRAMRCDAAKGDDVRPDVMAHFRRSMDKNRKLHELLADGQESDR
jgi:hypothetical protein